MGRISSLLLLLLVALLELLEAPLEGGRLSPGGPVRRQSQETQSSYEDRGLTYSCWVGGGAVLKIGQKHQHFKETNVPSFKNRWSQTHCVGKDAIELIFLPPPPEGWVYKPLPPCPVYGMLGIEARALCVLSKHTNHCATSPASREPFQKSLIPPQP